MKIDLSQFRETFLQESAEHILDIEGGLLQLKSGSSDDEMLNSVFRAAHSIKGGAGAFGLTEVVKFTHVLENLFDQMREHRIDVSAELITLLLRANDVLKELIGCEEGNAPEEAAEVQQLLEHAASPAQSTPAGAADSGTKNRIAEKPQTETHYRVSFRPGPNLFSVGSDPLLLLRNLAALGRVLSIKLDTSQVPTLAELKPDLSYLCWEVELITLAAHLDLDDIFEFVLDCAAVVITDVAAEVASKRTAAIVAASEATSKSGVERSTAGKAQPGRTDNSSVRVATDKIDKLIDIVGEMVIAHSIATRLVENLASNATRTALQESVASIEKYIRELHERTMSVRMLPLGSLFSRFNRLIHDLGQTTGKQLRLVTEGDETEVDRGILELLGDPLTHVLRNSADHGIESPEIRMEAGKNPEGIILLRASHQAGTVLIEVIDDGAGLNLARIREKATARKLIAQDAVLSDEQLRLLIFEPGFSTKEQVTELSGRGVGMDVVKRNVTALNGSISIDSNEGAGTHIKIQLPVTLAIMEGLIVRIALQNFVIPLISILETICLPNDRISSVAGRGEVALVRDEAIPFLRLRQMFALTPARDEDDAALGDRKLVLVVEHGNQRAALEVDELLGQQQIVVKSLERNFTKLEGTLGATILGDGKTALILDTQALITRRSRRQANSEGRTGLSLVA